MKLFEFLGFLEFKFYWFFIGSVQGLKSRFIEFLDFFFLHFGQNWFKVICLDFLRLAGSFSIWQFEICLFLLIFEIGFKFLSKKKRFKILNKWIKFLEDLNLWKRVTETIMRKHSNKVDKNSLKFWTKEK